MSTTIHDATSQKTAIFRNLKFTVSSYPARWKLLAKNIKLSEQSSELIWILKYQCSAFVIFLIKSSESADLRYLDPKRNFWCIQRSVENLGTLGCMRMFRCQVLSSCVELHTNYWRIVNYIRVTNKNENTFLYVAICKSYSFTVITCRLFCRPCALIDVTTLWIPIQKLFCPVRDIRLKYCIKKFHILCLLPFHFSFKLGPKMNMNYI